MVHFSNSHSQPSHWNLLNNIPKWLPAHFGRKPQSSAAWGQNIEWDPSKEKARTQVQQYMQDLANIAVFIMHKTTQTYRILLLGGTHNHLSNWRLYIKCTTLLISLAGTHTSNNKARWICTPNVSNHIDLILQPCSRHLEGTLQTYQVKHSAVQGGSPCSSHKSPDSVCGPLPLANHQVNLQFGDDLDLHNLPANTNPTCWGQENQVMKPKPFMPGNCGSRISYWCTYRLCNIPSPYVGKLS
jgi:hypothetical protein